MNNSKIIEEVKKILSKCEIHSVPIPIVEIAEKFGFEVFEANLKNESGFLFFSNNSGLNINGKIRKKVIAINTTDSPLRKRFTIAHELGHFFLEIYGYEKELDGDFFVHREKLAYKNLDRERDADRFAGELLLPTEFLEYELNNLQEMDLLFMDVAQYISNKFQVSYTAAKVGIEKFERRRR